MRFRGVFDKKIFIFIGLACMVFLGLGIYGNFGRLAQEMSRFRLYYLPLVLSLAFANYVLRYFRWEYYLRKLNIRIPARESLTIFFSGLTMAITPGKVGELLKSYLLKKGGGTPISHSIPVVVMERITDIISILLLALLGILRFRYGWKVFILGCGFLIICLLLLNSKRGLQILLKLPWLSKFTASLQASQERFRSLLAFRVLFVGLMIGILAWFSEAYAFWLVFKGLGVEVSVLEATFIYAFATLVGALSMLPGGLLTTETSMVGSLAILNLTKATSSAATLLIRVCTLWFAVVVGLIALWVYRKTVSKEIGALYVKS